MMYYQTVAECTLLDEVLDFFSVREKSLIQKALADFDSLTNFEKERLQTSYCERLQPFYTAIQTDEEYLSNSQEKSLYLFREFILNLDAEELSQLLLLSVVWRGVG